MSKELDISGMKFGRWTAIKRVENSRPFRNYPQGESQWLFKCDCGNFGIRKKGSVVNGHSQSCGCFNSQRMIQRNTIHGQSSRLIQKTKVGMLWNLAHSRSIKKNIPFSLNLEDIIIPNLCPLLKIPIYSSHYYSNDNSPSLDRINNKDGYIPGNIWVISKRANTIKNTATWEELLIISNNLEKIIKSSHINNSFFNTTKSYSLDKKKYGLEVILWENARRRSKKKGLYFNITPCDINVPTHCPLCNIELKRNIKIGPCQTSPTLDRIDNNYGYVRGNIQVVSFWANSIKNNASYEEIRTIALNLKEKQLNRCME